MFCLTLLLRFLIHSWKNVFHGKTKKTNSPTPKTLISAVDKMSVTLTFVSGDNSYTTNFSAQYYAMCAYLMCTIDIWISLKWATKFRNNNRFRLSPKALPGFVERCNTNKFVMHFNTMEVNLVPSGVVLFSCGTCSFHRNQIQLS